MVVFFTNTNIGLTVLGRHSWRSAEAKFLDVRRALYNKLFGIWVRKKIARMSAKRKFFPWKKSSHFNFHMVETMREGPRSEERRKSTPLKVMAVRREV